MKQQITRVIILAIIAALMVFFYVRSGGDLFGSGENSLNAPFAPPPIVGVRAPTQALPTLVVSGTPVTCDQTPFEAASPPGAQASDITPRGWFRSEDGKIWAGPDADFHIGSIPFTWLIPAGEQITITGRQINGQGPFLGVTPGSELGGGYRSDIINFPEAGCWQVNAETSDSRLSFTILVH